MQDGGLEKPPDIARPQMIGDIGKLTQPVKLVWTDHGVVVNARPAIETLPIPFENGMLDIFVKLSAGIRCRHCKLDCECIELFGIANSFPDSLDSIVW